MPSSSTSLPGADVTGAVREVHTIQGDPANVGGDALRAAALEAERAGQAGRLDAIMTRVPGLESKFARLEGAMRNSSEMARPGAGGLR
jgi:HPt (histidine-containing phosphotransfer) domain-containing protein